MHPCPLYDVSMCPCPVLIYRYRAHHASHWIVAFSSFSFRMPIELQPVQLFICHQNHFMHFLCNRIRRQNLGRKLLRWENGKYSEIPARIYSIDYCRTCKCCVTCYLLTHGPCCSCYCLCLSVALSVSMSVSAFDVVSVSMFVSVAVSVVRIRGPNPILSVSLSVAVRVHGCVGGRDHDYGHVIVRDRVRIRGRVHVSFSIPWPWPRPSPFPCQCPFLLPYQLLGSLHWSLSWADDLVMSMTGSYPWPRLCHVRLSVRKLVASVFRKMSEIQSNNPDIILLFYFAGISSRVLLRLVCCVKLAARRLAWSRTFAPLL